MHATEHPETATAPVAALMTENIEQTVARIIGILLEMCRLSGGSPRSDLNVEVRQISHLAQELGIQFGLNSAQLKLLIPQRGDKIQIGADVQDCEDGDCNRGSKYEVDLVTLPGLQRLGDGRTDGDATRTLVPCEIYPDQLH
jgi:hypothetical protein